MDVLQLMASLLGVLGIGSVIGNYVGAGRSRREVRSAVLAAVTAAEQARWANSLPEDRSPFRNAVRDLETAALIARTPRSAVQQYLLLADAARRYSLHDYEQKDGDEEMNAGSVDSDLNNVVQESVEVIAQLLWSPWWSRLRYRKELARLRDLAADIEDPGVKRVLALAQYARGRSAGRLAELYDKRFPEVLTTSGIALSQVL